MWSFGPLSTGDQPCLGILQQPRALFVQQPLLCTAWGESSGRRNVSAYVTYIHIIIIYVYMCVYTHMFCLNMYVMHIDIDTDFYTDIDMGMSPKGGQLSRSAPRALCYTPRETAICFIPLSRISTSLTSHVLKQQSQHLCWHKRT